MTLLVFQIHISYSYSRYMDRAYYNVTFNDTQLDYIYELVYHQWKETEHEDDRKVLASILNTIDLTDPLLGDSLETGTYHEHNT
jgi:hypothetical protein